MPEQLEQDASATGVGPAGHPAVPADRYGRPAGPRSRRRTVVALWALGLVGLAIVVWLGLGMARTPVTWQDVGFRIDDESVEVVFDVIRVDPSVPVRCRLEALSVRHAQVGVVTVDVPPGTDLAVRSAATIRISEPAVTGVVDTCWVE